MGVDGQELFPRLLKLEGLCKGCMGKPSVDEMTIVGTNRKKYRFLINKRMFVIFEFVLGVLSEEKEPDLDYLIADDTHRTRN